MLIGLAGVQAACQPDGVQAACHGLHGVQAACGPCPHLPTLQVAGWLHGVQAACHGLHGVQAACQPVAAARCARSLHDRIALWTLGQAGVWRVCCVCLGCWRLLAVP